MPRLDGDGDLQSFLVSRRPQSELSTGNWRTLAPVLDASRCTGCLLCWKFCPEVCIRPEDGKVAFDLRYCKGCGICAQECPPRCLAMRSEA